MFSNKHGKMLNPLSLQANLTQDAINFSYVCFVLMWYLRIMAVGVDLSRYYVCTDYAIDAIDELIIASEVLNKSGVGKTK